MSDLRKHLDAIKQDYDRMKYPGDLADQMLAPSRRISPLIWNVSAVLAVAASLAVVIWVRMPEPKNTEVAHVVQEDPTEEADDAVIDSFAQMPAISLPEYQSDLDLAPAAPDFSFSAPTFTFNIEYEQSEETTPASTSTEENVL